ILLGVQEEFIPTEKKTIFRLTTENGEFRAVVPMLILLLVIMSITKFEGSILPLFVQELNDGSIEGSARLTGEMSAVANVGAMMGGLLAAHLADRGKPGAVAGLCLLLAGIACAISGIFTIFWVLYAARFLWFFFGTAAEPVIVAWLVRKS